MAQILATLEPRVVSLPSDSAFSPPPPTAVPASSPVPLPSQSALPAHPSELHPTKVTGNAGAHLDQLVHFLETSRNPSTHPPQEISRSPYDVPILMLGDFSPASSTHTPPLEVAPVYCDPKPSNATVSSGNWESRETEAHLVPTSPTRGGWLGVLDPVISGSSYDPPSGSPNLTSPVGLQRSVGAGPSSRVDVSKHLNSTEASTRPSLRSKLKPEPVPKYGKQHLQPLQTSTRPIQGGPRKSIPSQARRIMVLFCQFAVATQDKFMQGHPMREQAKEKLRHDLHEYLTLWNTRKMRTGNVFELVSKSVRSCCPQAAKLDLNTEFKTWYKALLQQKNESTAGTDAKFVQREQVPLIPEQPMQVGREKHLDVQSTTAPRPIVTPVQSWRSGTGTQYPDLGLPLELPVNAERNGQAPNLAASSSGNPYPHFADGTHLQGSLRNIQSDRNNLSWSEQALASKATQAEIFADKKDEERKASQSQFASAMNQTLVSAPPLPISEKEPIDAHRIGSGLENIAHLRRLHPSSTQEKTFRVDSKDLLKAPTHYKEGKLPLRPTAFRTVHNSSEERSCTGQKLHTSELESRHAEGHFRLLSTNEKRPLDNGRASDGTDPRKRAKKSSKTIGEGTRAGKNSTPLSKKGSGCSTGPTSAQDMPTKRQTTAKNGKSRLVFGTSKRNADTSAIANTQIRSKSHARDARGVADDLALLGNVVNLDHEESFLAHDEKTVVDEDIEAVGYNDDFLLTTKALSIRMKAAARRNQLKEIVSRDAIEIISLAVCERLKSIFEFLNGASSVRVDADKDLWTTAVPDETVREKLERLFEEEERSLDVKAKLRLKKRKELAVIKAMGVSKTVSGEENDKTPALVASTAGRKARIAREKSLDASNNHKKALSGVLAGIQKMRRKAVVEKPLGSSKALLPLITGSGKLQNITSILPPLQTRNGSGGIIQRRTDELDRAGRKHEGLLKLGGPETTDRSHLPKGTVATKRKNRKYGLTLKDCLFLMESEQTTRRSSTLYKWYGRLGASR